MTTASTSSLRISSSGSAYARPPDGGRRGGGAGGVRVGDRGDVRSGHLDGEPRACSAPITPVPMTPTAVTASPLSRACSGGCCWVRLSRS